ncbi:patatin-like serine hydrolase [Alternaria alternata]|nr:patatin-like serine hydrolase [Alternaria alternata]
MAIRPPVPVPTMRSKCSHGFGTSCRFGARPSVSTKVRCINSWRIISMEYPRTPPPSVTWVSTCHIGALHHNLPSDRMRSGGPLVVSFRRTPLSAMFGVICAGCVGYHRF